MIKNVHRWTRLSSAKWEDAWEERLRFLAPEQVAFITWPDSRALKIEVYCDEKTGRQLVKRFGGKTTKIAPHIWSGNPAKPRAPLSIRSKLKVFSDEESWKKHTGKARGIFIPAGMAFGTGEHATTATCLRFLVDLVPKLPKDFAALDLGTGSGILAVAAEALGAGSVDAVDYDEVAVKITKRNAAKNRCKKITASEGDAVKISARGKYHIVMANIFSDALISSAPKIARSLKKGGWLIFSGTLKRQADEVAAAFTKEGLSQPKIVTRGKWCAAICRKEIEKPC